MGRAGKLLDGVRGAAAILRHNTHRVARVATRFNRARLYVFDLLIWSRVEAARSGLLSLDLPEGVLEKKGIAHPPPSLAVRTTDGRLDHFRDGFAAVNVLLFANLQLPDILSPHRYALPGPAFRGVYLWDSAFIAQIWRWWDREVALDVLRSVVSLRDGDRLQHVVADFVQSEFTQPPLIAWSLVELLDGNPSEATAGEFYPALRDYHQWLREHRRLQNGLYAWLHPYESGIDNSPRFSSRDERHIDPVANVGAPDFSTYAGLQAEALATLARLAGDPAAAIEYESEAAALREAMNRGLWHEGDGLYYDRKDGEVDGEAGFRRCATIASLLPLWAGAPDPVRAIRLRDQAIDPRRFGTLVPLPSVAVDDPAFEPDMWRGPVWINTAYGVLQGLRRCGFVQEAAELAWRLCDGVYRVFAAERQIYEFYDPLRWETARLHRKRGNWWKRLTLGGGPQREFVGWTGLVNNLVIEFLFGLRGGDAGQRVLRPFFPAEAVGAVFRLKLPAEDLTLEIAVESADILDGIVQFRSAVRSFQVRNGEEIAIGALFADPSVQR